MCTFTLFISTILRSLEAEFDMICSEKYINLNQLRRFQCIGVSVLLWANVELS